MLGFGWDHEQEHSFVREVVVAISFRTQCSVVVKVIRSKFGHASNNWDAVSITNSSHHSPWNGISQTLHLFLPVTKISVGCGNLVRFWLDPLTDPMSLRACFPPLFDLSSLKDGLLSSFRSSNHSWNSHFRRNLLILKLMTSPIF